MSDTIKYLLPEAEMPKNWYNIVADLPEPPPPVIHPGTGKLIGPDDLAPLFPMDLILQEVTSERFIDIPRPILDIYRQWRPSPLFRARRFGVGKSSRYDLVPSPKSQKANQSLISRWRASSVSKPRRPSSTTRPRRPRAWARPGARTCWWSRTR